MKRPICLRLDLYQLVSNLGAGSAATDPSKLPYDAQGEPAMGLMFTP